MTPVPHNSGDNIDRESLVEENAVRVVVEAMDNLQFLEIPGVHDMRLLMQSVHDASQ